MSDADPGEERVHADGFAALADVPDESLPSEVETDEWLGFLVAEDGSVHLAYGGSADPVTGSPVLAELPDLAEFPSPATVAERVRGSWSDVVSRTWVRFSWLIHPAVGSRLPYTMLERHELLAALKVDGVPLWLSFPETDSRADQLSDARELGDLVENPFQAHFKAQFEAQFRGSRLSTSSAWQKFATELTQAGVRPLVPLPIWGDLHFAALDMARDEARSRGHTHLEDLTDLIEARNRRVTLTIRGTLEAQQSRSARSRAAEGKAPQAPAQTAAQPALVEWSPEWVAAQWSDGQQTWLNARPGWLADQYADTPDPVLYDATMRTASSLGGLIVALWRDANTDTERAHWVARKALVDAQRHAVDPHDRAGMVAQQEAWLEQFYGLQDRRARHGTDPHLEGITITPTLMSRSSEAGALRRER